MKHQRFFILPFLLLVLISISACAAKDAPKSGPYAGPACMDVLTYPQDLAVYAKSAGKSEIKVSAGQAAASAAAQKQALYRPWREKKPPRWIQQSLAKNFNTNASNAFTDNKQPFPMAVWQGLVANSNKSAFGKNAGPAITLRHTNLRAMPGNMHFYLRPDLPGEGYPFDYFQHSSIAPGTPVYICNYSKDGQWVLVDGPFTAGWTPASDIAPVDERFMERWQSSPLAAVIRDHTRIGEMTGHTGTLLPLAGGASAGFGHGHRVFYPKRSAAGKAEIGETSLEPDTSVAVPLPLSADAVARIGNGMMGQAYGWGGLDEKRDCSALTRDLFAPFGIYLPRNSARQSRVGRVFNVAGLDNAGKEAAIIAQAVPFRSLVWLKGHIGVYLGVYQGKAMLFHNMWGLRIKDANGGCDNRAVVGKAVVTTLRPGIERPDLCSSGSFLERIERVAILPD